MSRGPFDLLISDCDGVLIDSEIVAHHVLVEMVGEALPGVDVEALMHGKHGLLTEVLLAEIAAATGWQVPEGFRKTLITRIREDVRRNAVTIPDVAAALAAIPLRKALVSNSGRPQIDHAVARGKLEPYFEDRIFSADLAPRPKPFPDVYLLAAKTLGVEPSRCVVIEDSIPGATAGLAAGMTVIGFTGASHISADHAGKLRALGVHAICGRMTDLPKTIETLQLALAS